MRALGGSVCSLAGAECAMTRWSSFVNVRQGVTEERNLGEIEIHNSLKGIQLEHSDSSIFYSVLNFD